jgi:hypothetical protein
VNTLPPSLVRFEYQLESAIRLRSGRSRRLARRTALAAAAAAAAALGVLSALPGNGPSVVERAAAALVPANGTILHVVMRNDELEIESWHQSSPPYDERQIIVSGDRRFEFALADGTPQVYDAETDTIYTGPAPRSPVAKPRATKKSGQDAQTLARGGDPYREKILSLLNSGKAHEDGRATIAGREVVRIASNDGALTLLVDADTYEPVEWRITRGSSTTTTRFSTYEQLEATEANAAALSLTAQHPDARVDTDAGHFEAAMQRLSPKPYTSGRSQKR